MKIFVTDFCKTVQAGVVIFGVHIDNDAFYHVIANQPSHAYSSLYLSDFLSFHILNNEIFSSKISVQLACTFFVEDFCETVQAGVVIFGKQVDNDVLYRGIANQPSPSYSVLYLSDFLSFHILNNDFFVKDFCELVQARVVIFGM